MQSGPAYVLRNKAKSKPSQKHRLLHVSKRTHAPRKTCQSHQTWKTYKTPPTHTQDFFKEEQWEQQDSWLKKAAGEGFAVQSPQYWPEHHPSVTAPSICAVWTPQPHREVGEFEIQGEILQTCVTRTCLVVAALSPLCHLPVCQCQWSRHWLKKWHYLEQSASYNLCVSIRMLDRNRTYLWCRQCIRKAARKGFQVKTTFWGRTVVEGLSVFPPNNSVYRKQKVLLHPGRCESTTKAFFFLSQPFALFESKKPNESLFETEFLFSSNCKQHFTLHFRRLIEAGKNSFSLPEK